MERDTSSYISDEEPLRQNQFYGGIVNRFNPPVTLSTPKMINVNMANAAVSGSSEEEFVFSKGKKYVKVQMTLRFEISDTSRF